MHSKLGHSPTEWAIRRVTTSHPHNELCWQTLLLTGAPDCTAGSFLDSANKAHCSAAQSMALTGYLPSLSEQKQKIHKRRRALPNKEAKEFFLVGALYLSAGHHLRLTRGPAGIEPPPAVCQRYKSAAIPTEPRGHLPQ